MMETLYDIFGDKKIDPTAATRPTGRARRRPDGGLGVQGGKANRHRTEHHKTPGCTGWQSRQHEHDSPPAISAPVVAVCTTSICFCPLESNSPRFAFAPSHTSFDASQRSSCWHLGCRDLWRSSTFVSGTSIGCIGRFKHGNGVQVHNKLGHNWTGRCDGGQVGAGILQMSRL